MMNWHEFVLQFAAQKKRKIFFKIGNLLLCQYIVTSSLNNNSEWVTCISDLIPLGNSRAIMVNHLCGNECQYPTLQNLKFPLNQVRDSIEDNLMNSLFWSIRKRWISFLRRIEDCIHDLYLSWSLSVNNYFVRWFHFLAFLSFSDEWWVMLRSSLKFPALVENLARFNQKRKFLAEKQ